jgi:hypothetical protein
MGMLKYKFVIMIVIGIFGFTMAACTAQPTVTYAEGTEKDQVAATAEPFAVHILDGIQKKDYAVFTSDFDPTMKSAMTQATFDKIVAMYAADGTLKNRTLINVEKIDKYYRVNYQLSFDSKEIIMMVVIPQTGTAAVSGLFFK